MIKNLLLGVGILSTFTAIGPPITGGIAYNHGLIDFDIGFDKEGNEDYNSVRFAYTSPEKTFNQLEDTWDFSYDVYLTYGPDLYTTIYEEYDAGTTGISSYDISGYRNNFYLDLDAAQDASIDLLLNGEPVYGNYEIRCNFDFLTVGYNDSNQLLFPSQVSDSVVIDGGSAHLRYLEILADEISALNSSGDYFHIVSITNLTVYYTATVERVGDMGIVIDNDYNDTPTQSILSRDYFNYINSLNDDVIVPEFNLSNFLITSIGGFMDFEIAPNISLGGVLGIILAFCLVFFIIKYFAGG